MLRLVLFSLLIFANTGFAAAQLPAADPLAAVKDSMRAGRHDWSRAQIEGLLDAPQATADPAHRANLLLLRGICFYEQKLPDEAIPSFRESLRLRAGSGGDASARDLSAAEVFFHLGNAFGATGQRDSSRIFHERCLAVRQRILGDEHPAVGFSLNHLAGCFIEEGDSDKAIQLRRRALHIFEKHGLHRHVFAVANNLAQIHHRLGDVGRAEIFFEKGLRHLPAARANSPDRARFFANFANLLAQTARPAEAQKMLDAAWAAFAKQPRDTAVWLDLAENTAACLRLGGRADSAARLDLERCRVLRQHRPAATSELGRAKLELAQSLAASPTALPAERLAAFAEASHFLKKKYGEKHHLLADAHTERARCLRKTGNLAAARAALDTALAANDFDPAAGTARLLRWESGYQTFFELARLELAAGDGAAALAAARRADSCLVWMRCRVRAAESKLRLSALARPLCEFAVEVAADLYLRDGSTRWLDAGFYFSEQSKNLLLAEQLLAFDPDFGKNSGDSLLDSLRREEDSLRAKIADDRKMLANLTSDATAARAKENQIFENLNRYDDLLGRLRRERPAQFDLRFGRSPVGADSISAWCRRRGRSLASYFLTEQAAFVFLFNPDTLLRLPLGFSLDSTVREMVVGIAAWHRDTARTDDLLERSLRRYCTAADFLYSRIFLSVHRLLPSDAGWRLIVVPDAELSRLPFDALLTRPPVVLKNSSGKILFQNLHFLAERLNVSYGFSASLVHRLSGRRDFAVPLHPLFAFAPFAYPRLLPSENPKKSAATDEPEPLPESETEVTTARRHIFGRVFLRTAARRDSFFFYAGEAGVLHVSTHGLGGGSADSVFLLFSGERRGGAFVERVSAADLSFRRWRARLAILSACESGLGEWAAGEGVLSMGRAFAGAGVPSVVFSLWSVSDSDAALLNSEFYRLLSLEKLPFDKALWRAKLALLDRDRGSGRLPFHWAGFVLSGCGD